MAKKSAFSQVIVWVIIALLVVGLAGFGVSNFGGSVRNVATVGQTEVTSEEYALALQNRVRQITQQTGQSLSMQQARAQGIDQQVLQSLLRRAALDEATRRAGISIGDDRIAEQIRQMQAFQGPDGTFSPASYQATLRQSGLTVSEFESQIRSELARNIVQSAFAAGAAPQPAYAEAIYGYLAGERDIALAEITRDDLEEPVPEPAPSEIDAYYDNNPNLFTLPERKLITYAWLRPEMLAQTIEIPEDALRAAYESRESEFVQPERRVVERLSFSDQTAAQTAMDRIDAGETTFDALVADRDLTLQDVSLGPVTRDDLGQAAEAVFGLESAGVVGPVPSSVGPAIFRINAVLAANTTSFERARPALEAEMAMAEATDIIDGEIEALRDLLASGATLEELADQSQMQLGTIEWSGGETGGIADHAAFRDAASAVTADDYAEIEVSQDGTLFALRLDEILPSELQPLSEVSDRAREGAMASEIEEALVARAETLAQDLDGDATFESLGLQAQQVPNVSRRSPPPGLPATAVETAFTLDEGAAGVATGEGMVFVVDILSVRTPDTSSDQAQQFQAQLTNQAGQAIAQDILTSLVMSIEQRVGITINDGALNAVHSQLP